jgi:hypothetical protein
MTPAGKQYFDIEGTQMMLDSKSVFRSYPHQANS